MSLSLSPFFDIRPDWRGWLIPVSLLFFLMMWFSLQWDLARHYVPDLAPDEWRIHSANGFIGGILGGWCLGWAGVTVAFSIGPKIVGYEQSLVAYVGSCQVSLLVGFAILGWQQARALEIYIDGALWWVGVMAFAWVPVLFVWLGYEAFVRGMDINIYPEAHTIVRVLAAEAVLLCPSLAIFAVIVRRSKPTSVIAPTHLQVIKPEPETSHRPTRLFAGLLLPLLVVVVAFGGLWLGKALRIERIWIASGPAGYLNIDANGNVNTLPPAIGGWDPSSKLRDSSPDGTKIAEVVGSQIVISATKDSESAIGPQGARTIFAPSRFFRDPHLQTTTLLTS